MKRIAILIMALVLLSALMGVPVAAKGAATTVWHVPGDFATIQAAIDSPNVVAGDTIMVGPGEWYGAVVTKAVHVKGEEGAVIMDGPAHPRYPYLHYGFKLGYGAGGSGATISHFTFSESLAFPVFAFKADNVTVEHCVMTSPIQGITNWEGNDWNINHNVINGLVTASGGGIGIFIGCYRGGTANNNLVAHNEIAGFAVVGEDDCGGYSGPGIGLMSDRRWGAPGGTLSGNRILYNKVSLSSTDPEKVWAVGIELTDLGLEYGLSEGDLLNNKVGFNDVRGVEGTQIALNPEGVAANNIMSRNLSDDTSNRGHGLHPKLFR